MRFHCRSDLRPLGMQIPWITLKELDATLSKDVFKHYRRWCRNKGNLATPCSHRFSAQRFGKDKWASYPELASVYKAAVVRTMMYWCSDFLKERDAGIPGGNLRVQTSHAFAAFQNLIDINGPFSILKQLRRLWIFVGKVCSFIRNWLELTKIELMGDAPTKSSPNSTVH